MRRIQSKVRTGSDEFRESDRYHRELARELNENLNRIADGGSERARKKHTDRGKLLVRDRIEKLFDQGTPF